MGPIGPGLTLLGTLVIEIQFDILMFLAYIIFMHEWSSVDWSQSNGRIAKRLGISASTVSRYRVKNNIPPSSHTRNPTIDLYAFSSATKPIRDPDYEFAAPKKSWRSAVKSFYGSACQICGYHKLPIPNHCHHIVPKFQGGLHTVSNAVVLCSRCHDEVHAGILDLSQFANRENNNRQSVESSEKII